MPGSSCLCRRRASWRFFHHALTRLPGGAWSQLSTALSSAGPHRLWMTAAPTNGRCSLTSMGIHSPQERPPLPGTVMYRSAAHCLTLSLLAFCAPAFGAGQAPPADVVTTRPSPCQPHACRPRKKCSPFPQTCVRCSEAGDPAQLLPRPAVAGARRDDLRPARAGPAVRRQCDLHRQRYWQHRRANCLAFTLLFVTLAREAGIQARVQEVGQVVSWYQDQDAGVVYSVGHVNAGVDVGGRFRRRSGSQRAL